MKWNRNISVLPLFLLSLLALQVSVRADSKQAEAQALLDKAEKLSRLTEKGSPPFALQATIESGEGKQTADFYLLWQDAEHWRAMAVEDNRREIYVRNPEGLWLPAVPDFDLASALSYGMSFPFVRGLAPSTESFDAVQNRKVNGQTERCVLLYSEIEEREICTAPTSGLVHTLRSKAPLTPRGLRTMIRLSSDPAVDPDGDSAIEYEEYEKFGEKWVPQRIRWIAKGRTLAEVRLRQLNFKAPGTREMFASPDGYVSWQDCEQYSYASAARVFLSGFKDLPSHGADGVFITVGPDGRPLKVDLINPHGPKAYRWVTLLRDQQYEPATCDGRRVAGYILAQFPIPR